MWSINKILLGGIVILALSSCAAQDNNGNTYETESSDKVPVSQAWDGYEELQGKQYGNIFKMPEMIEPVRVETLYSFVPKDRPDWDRVKAGAETFFKAMYGDSYGSENIIESISPGGVQQIQYLSSEDDAMVTSSGIVYAYRNGYRSKAVTLQPETLGSYDPKTSRDVMLHLDDGDCTVGELCDQVAAFSKNAFYPMYEGYELEPVYVSYQSAPDMSELANVVVGIKRDGIFMETYPSQLFEQEHRKDYDVLTYYSFNQMSFTMSGKDSILGFTNVTLLSKMQEVPVNKIIPLKSAVKLLETSLAEQSDYRFQKIDLMYCQKFTYPALTGNESLNSEIMADYGEIPDQPFVPTWCFTWTTDQGQERLIQHIKVNAVTGEITVDV